MAVKSHVRDQIRSLVVDFFSDECEVDAETIGDGTRIIEDLEGDSLMLLALLRKASTTYGITVELKALGKHLMKLLAARVDIANQECGHGMRLLSDLESGT